MKIHGDLYRRRTDIVGFVNGIPLLFVELKKNSVDVQNAYTDNYTDYLDTIPQLFYYNAFLMLSNGVEMLYWGYVSDGREEIYRVSKNGH